MGTISAVGGGGANFGGAGTILLKTNYTTGVLIVDNGGNVGTNTPIANEGPTGYSLQVRNGAVLALVNSVNFSNVLVTSNAWIIPGSSSGQVQLAVGVDATIDAGGGIIADSFGSPQNTGTGSGHIYGVSPYYPGSGAGHGGYGAYALSNRVPGGAAYDNAASPIFTGSGGGGLVPYSPGGSGGGLIHLNLAGGVLQLNGTISANGGNGSGIGGGGGSGGSIDIVAVGITGTGSITANGGNGAAAGGGGAGGLIS
ncbi:MAG: hypothetical protein ACRED1_02155, partial [Limisphaerales bacterium]